MIDTESKEWFEKSLIDPDQERAELMLLRQEELGLDTPEARAAFLLEEVHDDIEAVMAEGE